MYVHCGLYTVHGQYTVMQLYAFVYSVYNYTFVMYCWQTWCSVGLISYKGSTVAIAYRYIME